MERYSSQLHLFKRPACSTEQGRKASEFGGNFCPWKRLLIVEAEGHPAVFYGVDINRKESRVREGNTKRRLIQWFLLPVVIVTIGLGWKYPWLGYSVPIVMLMGMVGGIFNGRYVCGNLCPRGSFLERFVGLVSRKGEIPSPVRNMVFRWILFSAMMGFMIFQISRNPSDWQHWGRVFWLMCTVTTGLGIVLAFAFQSRTWCALCPMGTMQNALGGGKNQIKINAATCRECGLCEKSCPMDLDIIAHKAGGKLAERDCLKCDECVVVCPTKSLKS
ncbi:MAG: FeS-binding protein [Verrucomicrobia bacterium]|nr:FeS-binding protein [Verrucomicrobiota bacterium]